MKINIYLDDLRKHPNHFVLAKTYEEGVKLLKENKVGILSLDHDLGENPKTGELLKTGYDLVKYICQNNIFVEKIYIHTDNVIGRENMYQTLKSAQRRGFISKDIEIFNYPLYPNIYE